MNSPKVGHREYHRTLDRDDLWRQVRRTVNGKPVSEEQIAMIVQAIRIKLQLRGDDIMLDLACGNGALASYLIDDCAMIHGVDLSEYLIGVADSQFAVPHRTTFLVDDAAHYIENEPDPARFTKVLCYGSFSYFSEADAVRVLTGLARRFVKVERVFVGNLPDARRADRFYPTGKDYCKELRDHSAPIGMWRSESELRNLASMTGWNLEISIMPSDFYAAHYRFDAVLTR
jgi:cyclopropane fatty-acyl-phospholipid synthase-like methyltransferase